MIRNIVGSRAVPLGSFASVMGIAGLGLAWRVTAKTLGVPREIGELLIFGAVGVFVILLPVWIARIRSHPTELRNESNRAITSSYFGTITISCSLLAAGLLPYSRVVATVLWAIAAFGGGALLIYLFGRWIEGGIDESELTPALFIPVVGNATSVYAAVPLGYSELGWASFSCALLCWISLASITMLRLLVGKPRLPRKLAPQLGVMVSSPAVLASAWYVLTDSADPVFKILAFKALFFTFLTMRLWRMAWGEPFNVAMWGYTFPAAALAGAFARADAAIPSPLYRALASATLALATIIVVICIGYTCRGWLARAVGSNRSVIVDSASSTASSSARSAPSA